MPPSGMDLHSGKYEVIQPRRRRRTSGGESGGGAGGGPSGGAVTDYFTSYGGAWGFEPLATDPSAVYDSSVNKTIQAYSVWNGQMQEVHVASYDHATSSWSDSYPIGNVCMFNDTHGQPALFKDQDGYWWCFYGPHSQLMPYSRSKNPNDITAWIGQSTSDLVGYYTYPHPTFVPSQNKVYLFLRSYDSVNTWFDLYIRIGTISGGVISWAAEVKILNWLNSRVYQGNHILVGNEIQFLCTQANTGDTSRFDVFAFRYNVTDGSIKNWDGTVTTLVGAYPISLATCQTSYRIVNGGGLDGQIPLWADDTNGNRHVIFMRAASVIGGPFNFYHIVSVGGAPNVFSSATLLGSFGTSGPYNHRYDGYAIAQLPSGGMRVFWPKASGSFVRGSPTLSYRDRDSGGVWSAEADWFSVSDGSALDAPMAVKNGLSSYRMAITNNSGDGTLNVPSGSNPGPGPGNKLYAFDDNKNKVIRIPASPRQYLSQTELALNRMTVAPSSARAALYDTLIRGLRSDGIADLLDALYLPKCHDRQAARINILRSGWDLTETNSGSITFVTDNYIAGNGTTSYLSMVLNPQFQQTPSLNLGGGSILRYNQNSASVFGVTGNLGDAGTAFGFGDATNFRIGVANINSTQLATRLNREAPTTTISLGTNGGIGFAGVTRKDINNISYNVNGTQATVAQAATGLTLTGFGFCGQGVGTSFSNRQVKAAGFGGGLTPAQLELLRIRINNFLSAF